MQSKILVDLDDVYGQFGAWGARPHLLFEAVTKASHLSQTRLLHTLPPINCSARLSAGISSMLLQMLVLCRGTISDCRIPLMLNR